MALGNFSGEKIGTKAEERRQKSSYPNWGTKWNEDAVWRTMPNSSYRPERQGQSQIRSERFRMCSSQTVGWEGFIKSILIQVRVVLE